MAWPEILNPRRITVQIALLVLAAVTIFHIVATTIFLVSARNGPPAHPGDYLSKASLIIAVLDATPPAERATTVTRLDAAASGIGIQKVEGQSPPPGNGPGRRFLRLHNLPGGVNTWSDPEHGGIGPGHGGQLFARLSDGDTYSLSLPSPALRPPFGGIAIQTLAFVGLSIVMLSLWAARTVVGPLETTAEAARRYSIDDVAQPLAERGPMEVRQLALAMNQMQARISKLVGDRTRVVAAMSHDLRTPITRLRMRADYMDDPTQRHGMVSDLDQMERMVHGALAYMRDGRTGEPLMPTELPSVLETIRDQYADIGVTIAYEGPDSLRIRIRPSEIERAVTNLVENALKYGGSAALRLTRTEGGVAIEVEDHGPGIPPDQREAMLEPFARGDVARALDDKTGFGLGLTIARAIASAHGGQLTLRSAQPNGLIARIELPLAN